MPFWKAKAGKGKHGVPDKGAHKVGKQWEKNGEKAKKVSDKKGASDDVQQS